MSVTLLDSVNKFPFISNDISSSALSLDQLMVKSSASTFFFSVDSNNLSKLGIHKGDLAVVDRSIKPLNNDLLIAYAEGVFLIRQLVNSAGQFLLSDGGDRQVAIKEFNDFEVWGSVTYIIKSFLK